MSPPSSPLIDAYLARRPALVRFFAARTRSDAEAEDIVQELFVRIAKVPAETVENPAAYLYRLGSNIHLDRLRSARRSVARDAAYQETMGDGDAADPISAEPSPEARWTARRRLAEVMAVVETFPPQRLRVFTRHKLDGRSYAEVAAELGISKSAVEKHMMAALRQLAELGS